MWCKGCGRVKRHGAYVGRRWRTVRRQVLVRDAYVCKIGLPGCRGVADSVDHRIELEDGGAALDLSNLQAACLSCNVAKGNKARGARKRGREAGTVREW